MTRYLYYPGCTLKSTATAYEQSAYAVAEALGFQLVELERWNCCGVVYGMAEDAIIHHVGAVRNLIRAEAQAEAIGSRDLVVLCSMCFNVLRRVHLLLNERSDIREKLTRFLDDEPPYQGVVRVRHLLEVLRDDVGVDRIQQAVARSLSGLRIATYYGCTLLRPKGIGIDDPENPTVLEALVAATGATSIDHPMKIECCGSYQVVTNPDAVTNRVRQILTPLARHTPHLIVTACPLCHHNLLLTHQKDPRTPTPAYITELLAYAFGRSEAVSPEVRQRIESVTS